MIAIKPTQMRDNFKSVCDQVVNGETVIVSRPNNENVVVISEERYNAMLNVNGNNAYHERWKPSPGFKGSDIVVGE